MFLAVAHSYLFLCFRTHSTERVVGVRGGRGVVRPMQRTAIDPPSQLRYCVHYYDPMRLFIKYDCERNGRWKTNVKAAKAISDGRSA